MTKKDWTSDYFGDSYLQVYSRYMTDPEEVRMEADFVLDQLGVKKGDAILDLACGFGRHLRSFFLRGIRAVGLDNNFSYLKFASGKMKRGKEFEAVMGDMYHLPFKDNVFHALSCLFNSFGYVIEDEKTDHRPVLKEAARVLKPGGGLFIEVPNRIPVIEMTRETPQTLQAGEDFLIHEFWDYNTESDVLYNRSVFMMEGKEESAGYRLRLYSPDEMEALLEKVGFSLTKIFGDYDGQDYSENESPKMLVAARVDSNPTDVL